MTARLSVTVAASLGLHVAALAGISALPPVAGQGSLGGTSPGRATLTVFFHETAERPDTRAADKPMRPQAGRSARTRPRAAVPADVYYPADQLDERPQVRAHVEPQFPQEAHVTEGRLRLHLYIGTDGAVEKVDIREAMPPDIFDRAALAAFSAARFTAGKKGGVPVKSRLTIEVLFGAPAPLTQSAAAFGAPR